MSEFARQPLLVEVFLQGGHVSGLSRLVEERRRLVDVLNGQEALFELESARLTIGAGGGQHFLRLVEIKKSTILAAIPHETDEQVRARAVLNTGLSRSTTMQAQIGAFLPPLYIEGTAHAAPGAGKIRADPRAFTPFFPLTSAVLYLPDNESMEAEVIVVNRDAISAMSLLSDPGLSRLAV